MIDRGCCYDDTVKGVPWCFRSKIDLGNKKFEFNHSFIVKISATYDQTKAILAFDFSKFILWFSIH